ASGSFTSSGIASVSTVAAAATAAKSMARSVGSCSLSMRKSTMARSEIEVDHLAHHQDADRHPKSRGGEHDFAELLRPKQRDVIGARQIDEDHDHDRQR